jgi:hypothetical protein
LILAIDPGPVESAFVRWDGGSVLEKGKVPNAELLTSLYSKAGKATLVLEMVASYGMAVGVEVFETVFWIGRFYEAYSGPKCRVKRLKIKLHHCQDSRAKDSNIRQALIDRLGAPGTKKNPGVTYGVSKDVWSALAIATYAHDCMDQLEVEATF